VQPVSATSRFADWLHDAAGYEDAILGPVLTGGNSNVTRLVETRQGRLILRHPPVNLVSDKAAAGIEREFRAISALDGKAPVPRPIAWCADASILGQPFAITEWINGVALTDELPSDWENCPSTINRLGTEMVQGLAKVHAIKWDEVIDEDFGRPEGFVTRQIDRWLKVRAKDQVRDLPLLEEIGGWLRDNQPTLTQASIIHCDFHLDNCLMAVDEPRLLAILDWEMATLGDPLIDLGLCLFFWKRDPTAALGFSKIQRLSNRANAISAAELADVWSNATGFDHANLNYYIVFAAWRLAAIVEGAWVLCHQGKVDTAYARGLKYDVPALLSEAAQIIEKGKI